MVNRAIACQINHVFTSKIRTEQLKSSRNLLRHLAHHSFGVTRSKSIVKGLGEVPGCISRRHSDRSKHPIKSEAESTRWGCLVLLKKTLELQNKFLRTCLSGLQTSYQELSLFFLLEKIDFFFTYCILIMISPSYIQPSFSILPLSSRSTLSLSLIRKQTDF